MVSLRYNIIEGKRKSYALIASTVWASPLILSLSGNAMAAEDTLDPNEDHYELKLLGKYGFFDKISEPERMACVTCHDPDTGGTASNSGVNLHQVVITGAALIINPATLPTDHDILRITD
jgi:cytochrome c peroxidase